MRKAFSLLTCRTEGFADLKLDNHLVLHSEDCHRNAVLDILL